MQMEIKTEHSQIQKWSQLAKLWMNYLPPSRPSLKDLIIYKTEIRTHFAELNKVQALVLGATPELRDLLGELKTNVTVVDQNPYMINEMTRIRIYNNCESIIVDDWFDFLSKRKESFNLVVSDLTQSNIPYDKHEVFYKLISEVLVPGGIFIDRVYTYRDNSNLYTANNEFLCFSRNPSINLLSLNDLFVKCFLASDLVANSEKIDTDEITSAMRSLGNLVLDKYANLIEEYLAPRGAIWYCGKHWMNISKKYFFHLNLLKDIPNEEPMYKNIPHILISTPKGN